jgi:hypothetical protein
MYSISDKRGPEYTKHDYVSMYNNEENHQPMMNLGYLEEEDKSHFVFITKLNCIISEKYYSHKKLICTRCSNIFSTREALLNYEKSYHSTKELPAINLPQPDKAFINFDVTREADLKKTVYYPFVCYADFEASTKVANGKTVLIPNSYVILSSDLMFLTNDNMFEYSYLKSYCSDNPDDLMRHFVTDLNRRHNSHMMRMDENKHVLKLTEEEKKRYNDATKCEIVTLSSIL